MYEPLNFGKRKVVPARKAVSAAQKKSRSDAKKAMNMMWKEGITLKQAWKKVKSGKSGKSGKPGKKKYSRFGGKIVTFNAIDSKERASPYPFSKTKTTKSYVRRNEQTLRDSTLRALHNAEEYKSEVYTNLSDRATYLFHEILVRYKKGVLQKKEDDIKYSIKNNLIKDFTMNNTERKVLLSKLDELLKLEKNHSRFGNIEDNIREATNNAQMLRDTANEYDRAIFDTYSYINSRGMSFEDEAARRMYNGARDAWDKADDAAREAEEELRTLISLKKYGVLKYAKDMRTTGKKLTKRPRSDDDYE